MRARREMRIRRAAKICPKMPLRKKKKRVNIEKY
jgi:hypothetical protein